MIEWHSVLFAISGIPVEYIVVILHSGPQKTGHYITGDNFVMVSRFSQLLCRWKKN